MWCDTCRLMSGLATCAALLFRIIIESEWGQEVSGVLQQGIVFTRKCCPFSYSWGCLHSSFGHLCWFVFFGRLLHLSLLVYPLPMTHYSVILVHCSMVVCGCYSVQTAPWVLWQGQPVCRLSRYRLYFYLGVFLYLLSVLFFKCYFIGVLLFKRVLGCGSGRTGP